MDVRRFRLCGLLVALALLPCSLEAQSASSFDEVGRFYMQSFGPEDYDADAQNWAIVQSLDGLIYVGNGDGVLEYDGVSWRLIPVSNRTVVRSLAVDAEGRVFVGADGELGYLAPDPLGRMRYVSLVDHIPPDDRAFTDVWRIEKTADGLYFRTNERLFRWHDQAMKVWRPETRFRQVVALGDTLYVQQDDVGLMHMDDGSLAIAPGGALFRDRVVRGLVPHGEDGYLAITRKGMFRCAAEPRAEPRTEPVCAPFSPGLTDLLATSKVYHATVLPGGILALATLRGGVILVDEVGRPLRSLNVASGLRDENVKYTYVDRQGGLWLGLNNGLARVEIDASLSYYDTTLGLLGNVQDVARHQGRLYAATSLGVYRLEPAADGSAPRFMPSSGISTQCWSLLSTPEGLLAGCNDGLYNLDAQQVIFPLSDAGVYEAVRSRQDPTLLYLGLSSGLARMRLRAGRWTDAGRIPGIRESVRSIVEDARGRLWMGLQEEGVLRLEAARALSDEAVVSRSVATRSVATRSVATRFGTAQGLPAGQIVVQQMAGRVVFVNRAGLFRLADPTAEAVRFVPDTTFDAILPAPSKRDFRLVEDARRQVWLAAGEASAVARPQPNGSTRWTPSALRRAPTRDVYSLHVEADGALWVGGPHGLIRCDTNRSPDPATSYPLWIRRVTTATDALLFDGQTARSREAAFTRPHRDNAPRFAFAAPRYDAPERTRYRTRLDGLDDHWSAWTDETHRDFTNLREGGYVFRAQARDVHGQLSREDTFAFRILAPWYRAWWAWALYGLMAAGSIWGGYRLRTRSLRRLNAELEQRVRDRTAEIEAKNDELEAKNDELERFTYTVSHDLKAPLVTIRGFLGFARKDAATGDSERLERDLARIDATAEKMLGLLEDLLELSRVGLLVDRSEDVAFGEIVDEALELVAGTVRERGVEVEVASDLPVGHGDRARLVEALQNLLENAVRYMGRQASPRIEIGWRRDESEQVLFVRDNGIGIDPEYHGKIFELFERLDPGGTEGTGSGLALVQRIVEAHGGRIWVESEGRRRGSTFCFTLPRGAGGDRE